MERLKEGNPAAGVSFLSRIGIKPGDVVLHVASGYGTDPLLSSRQVGPRGRVIGLDTTWEMVHRGKKTAQEAGADNVEFRFGQMEEMPIEDESIDLVVCNYLVNLASDKSKVFREVFRVLRPKGRLFLVSIVVNEFPALDQHCPFSSVCYFAGAMEEEAFLRSIQEARFSDMEILERTPLNLSLIDRWLKNRRSRIPKETEDLWERYRDQLDGKIVELKVIATKPSSS